MLFFIGAVVSWILYRKPGGPHLRGLNKPALGYWHSLVNFFTTCLLPVVYLGPAAILSPSFQISVNPQIHRPLMKGKLGPFKERPCSIATTINFLSNLPRGGLLLFNRITVSRRKINIQPFQRLLYTDSGGMNANSWGHKIPLGPMSQSEDLKRPSNRWSLSTRFIHSKPC